MFLRYITSSIYINIFEFIHVPIKYIFNINIKFKLLKIYFNIKFILACSISLVAKWLWTTAPLQLNDKCGH